MPVALVPSDEVPQTGAIPMNDTSDVGLSDEQMEAINEQADDDCDRCGGSGRIIKRVAGHEGMVPCPNCRGDKRTQLHGGGAASPDDL